MASQFQHFPKKISESWLHNFWHYNYLLLKHNFHTHRLNSPWALKALIMDEYASSSENKYSSRFSIVWLVKHHTHVQERYKVTSKNTNSAYQASWESAWLHLDLHPSFLHTFPLQNLDHPYQAWNLTKRNINLKSPDPF